MQQFSPTCSRVRYQSFSNIFSSVKPCKALKNIWRCCINEVWIMVLSNNLLIKSTQVNRNHILKAFLFLEIIWTAPIQNKTFTSTRIIPPQANFNGLFLLTHTARGKKTHGFPHTFLSNATQPTSQYLFYKSTQQWKMALFWSSTNETNKLMQAMFYNSANFNLHFIHYNHPWYEGQKYWSPHIDGKC